MNLNNNILVSVIIPTFNRSHLLKRAINSILSQKYNSYEIIVIDNYSLDQTVDMVNSYNDHRIKLIKFKNNGNIAASRNIGIKEAKGEWIAFLDSDDWWHQDKLEYIKKYMNYKNDFIYHKLKIIREKNNYFFNKNFLETNKLYTPKLINLLLYGNVINNSSVIVRKKILDKVGGISEKKDYITAEDYHTWLRISQITENFFYIPKCLGYYFIHSQNFLRHDMSVPAKNVTNEFRKYLNKKQLRVLDSRLNYMSGRYNFQLKNYKDSKAKFFLSFTYLSFKLKLKVIYMILNIYLIKIFISK